MGSESNDRCNVVMAALRELRERIEKFVCESNELVDTPSSEKLDHDGCRVLSHVAVHAKGRLPFKRTVSRVDVTVWRKKESVRRKHVSRKGLLLCRGLAHQRLGLVGHTRYG